MNFEEARKKSRKTVEKLAEESGFEVNLVRKLKKGKYPVTKALKRIFDPIMDSDLDAEMNLSKELKVLEEYIQDEIDCVLDENEDLKLITVTAFFEEGRVRTIIRRNQISLDNPQAIKNEARGLIYELKEERRKQDDLFS